MTITAIIIIAIFRMPLSILPFNIDEIVWQTYHTRLKKTKNFFLRLPTFKKLATLI